MYIYMHIYTYIYIEYMYIDTCITDRIILPRHQVHTLRAFRVYSLSGFAQRIFVIALFLFVSLAFGRRIRRI